MPVEEARALARSWHIENATFAPATAVGRRSVRTDDIVVPSPAGEIPVRLYRPGGEQNGRLPAIMFFHGGGYVIGDLDTHDELCRELSSRVPALVASVHYRRGPEFRYPAAVEDCLRATAWLAERAGEFGADGTRLAVAGDSAGGNLAAVVARSARDAGAPKVLFQVLIYPVTDNTQALDRTASAVEYGDGLELTLEGLHWFQDQYFADDQATRAEANASPLYVEDLTGLPPALVLVADLDPIADTVIGYASRLAAAHVDVRVVRFPGLMHAFVTMGSFFDAAFDAADVAVEALKTALRAMPTVESPMPE